jgi:hypothetical protein
MGGSKQTQKQVMNTSGTSTQNVTGSTDQSTFGGTFQQRDPYAAATPAINQAISGIQGWQSNPQSAAAFNYSPSAFSQAGMGMIGNSMAGKNALDYFSGVANGDYLNAGNPYQADLDKNIIASVMPSLNSTFSNAGMAGSTLHQGAVTQGLTSGLAAPRYQNYQNERSMQQQAAGLMPGLETGIGQNQLAAGQLQEGYDKANFDEQRTAGLRPYLEAGGLLQGYGNIGGTVTGANYGNASGTSSGSTTGTTTGTQQGTTTTKDTPSLGSQIAGGALMGLGLMGGLPGLGMIGSGLGLGGQVAPQGSLPWQQGYTPFNGWLSGN